MPRVQTRTQSEAIRAKPCSTLSCRYSITRSLIIDIGGNAPAQRRDIDVMHASLAREIERMRGRRAHRDAWAHHTHARKRRRVAIDASARGHQVVDARRCETAERDVVYVIFRKRLPHISLGVMVLFERPGRARDAVFELHAGAYLFHSQMVAAHDPARLPDAGQSIRPHARFAECFRILAL